MESPHKLFCDQNQSLSWFH